MALAADSKKLYIDLPNIEAKRMNDAEGEYYRLTPQGFKAITDTFYSLAHKIQGNIALADLTDLAVESLTATTVITQNLYSVFGDIAELTVDRVVTADKVQRYKDGDTTDINYVRIQDQSVNFVTGTTTGTTEQHKDRNGDLLYWKDSEMKSMGTDVTSFPVTIYVYVELVKLQVSFVLENGTYVPKLVVGAGTGTADNDKLIIYKPSDKAIIKYITNVGNEMTLQISSSGIECIGNVGVLGIRNIAVGSTEPSNPQTNDLWIDTDA